LRERANRYPGSHGWCYRCHQQSALTAFPPFFLFLDPVQGVFAHWTPRHVKAPNKSKADALKPHPLEAYSVV
jgi:hypothetical protein